MVTGVARGLQNRSGAFARPGWVRFPHVPAIALALAIAGAAALSGQDPVAPAPAPADTAAARPDTVPPVTPLGALARSMVIPGWGQLEVGRPGRGAFYFVTEAASLFMVFKSHAKLSAARALDPPNDGLVESRTEQRENWIVIAGFIAFLSGVDAWVSTHFWDFEPTVEVPAGGSDGIAVGIRWKVP